MSNKFDGYVQVLSNGKKKYEALKDGELYLLPYQAIDTFDICLNGDEGFFGDIIDETKSSSDYAKKALMNSVESRHYDYDGYTYCINPAQLQKQRKKLLGRFNEEKCSFDIVGSDIKVFAGFEDAIDNLLCDSCRDFNNFYKSYLFALDYPFIYDIANCYEYDYPILYTIETASQFSDKICNKDDLIALKKREKEFFEKIKRQYNKTISVDEELAHFYNGTLDNGEVVHKFVK